MRTQRLSREEFLEWLAHRSDGVGHDKRLVALPINDRLGRQSVTLIWLDSRSDEEPIIAVEPEDMRDFLAFVSTYVGNYSPFTAFFRVISKPFADELPRQPRRISQPVLGAFLGSVICDSAVQMGTPPPRVSDISVQAALATPSSAMIAALLLGYDLDVALAIVHRWYSVRSDLGLTPSRISADELMGFWSLASAALLPDLRSKPDNGPVNRLVRNLVERRNGTSDVELSELSHFIPNAHLYAQSLNGSREDRVRALEAFVAQLPPGRADDNMDVALGYFIAQVAEGSLNYLSLAAKASERYPTSMLWYGFFAGLSPYSEVLTAGDCLGRRIIRRLAIEGGPTGPIHADISYEELALYQQEKRLSRLRKDQASTIEVELMPGITGKYRLPRTPRREEELTQITSAWDILKKLTNQMQSVIRETELKGPQRQLFEDGQRQEGLSKLSKQPIKKKPYR